MRNSHKKILDKHVHTFYTVLICYKYALHKREGKGTGVSDLKRMDNMVLVTRKEQRNGYVAPLGTIYYTYHGEDGPYSVRPNEPHYGYFQARYEHWKQEQADQVRRQRDQEALAKILEFMQETRQRNEQLTLMLPGDPPAKARLRDDFSMPLQPTYRAEAVENDIIASVSLEPSRHRYGCYFLNGFYTKVIPGGTMGRKQEARGKALEDRLIAFVKTRLLEAGWRIAMDEPGTVEKWRWEGAVAKEREERLAQLTHKIWRGRGERSGNEKIADLPDDALLFESIRPGQWHPVPGNEQLEYFIDPDAQQLRVRRHRVIPQPQEQQRTPTKLVLGIVGDEGRARGAGPAYHRTISTRPVTFICRNCKQEVTQERLPGPTPRYCSDACQGEAKRQKTLERVRRLRAERKKSEASSEILTS
jgi:hypothetical protein